MSLNGFSGHEMIRFLSVLTQHNYGKKVVQMVDQKAQQAVLSGRGTMLSIQWMWDEYWKEHNPPDAVMDSLIDQNGECHHCPSPMFYEIEGESGCKYCSDECAEDNHDTRSEYSVDCDKCGHRFDSLSEGYYLDMTGTQVCDAECAWAVLSDSRDASRFFSNRPDLDEEATWAAIKRVMSPSEITDMEELATACDDHGVSNQQCAECEDYMSASDAIHVEDIGDSYDCEHCAWDGILDYTDAATCAKLKAHYKLTDLLGFNDLDEAIEQIEEGA